MKVLPQNRLRIVCPSAIAVNDWIERKASEQYQNFWLVDKNGYDNCKVNDDTNPSMNKLLLTCNTPNKINFLKFEFHPRFNLKEPFFVPGRHYYFIGKGKNRWQEKEENRMRKNVNTSELYMRLER